MNLFFTVLLIVEKSYTWQLKNQLPIHFVYFDICIQIGQCSQLGTLSFRVFPMRYHKNVYEYSNYILSNVSL